MKSAKQAKSSTLQNSPLLKRSSPSLKKKAKQKYETEPMVLMASDAPENIAQYSIDIPSVNKDRMLDEMDMLKNITVHLNQIVRTMEHVYTMGDEIKEEKEVEEETLPHEREDMVCFLIFCSQLSNQLEISLREEKQILESLFKWFEKEVQMFEELGEEEIIPDWQIPVADKNITENINKLMNRIQRLEDLKGRVQELPKYIRVPTPREKRRPLAATPGVVRDPKNILEELATKHATEDVMNMVRVFQEESGAPQTIESMNNRIVEIMKIFERQTNKLHRVTNEQDVLEGKLQKIQQDFRKLAEEKQIMEDELQKMKASDIIQEKGSADTRKKLLARLEKEKAKIEERTSAQGEKGKKPQKVKDSEAVKVKEDLAIAQANIQSLEREKKMLEEKLQKVLEEANIARGQFTEIPPDIPDWEFTYKALEETEKELPKKSKKGTKLKGKVSVIDGTVQKVSKLDTVKASETLPGKSQEISTALQAKDGKGKKKGTDLSEIERTSVHKIPSTGSEKLPKQPGKSETPSKTDAKGVIKPKESAELKKQRSVVKGTGREPHGSADTVLPPLPPDQEKQLLPESTYKQAEYVEITSEKQKEMLPEITSAIEKQKEMLPEITSAIELKEETLPVTVPEPADLVSSHLAESEEFVKESESLILEKATALPRLSLRTWPEPIGLQEDEMKDLIDKGMLQLVDHLTDLKGIPEAETVAKFLLDPNKNIEVLPYAQKLQLINQLIAAEGQQEAEFPIPEEEGQVVDKEQREKKRHILANIASTLNLLHLTQAEAGQTEEEVNEMAKMKKILLADLESNLKDLQQAETVVPTQEDLENKTNELTKKRSLLISVLESNLINLKEARAIAATQPSEISKNQVKELLQEREALTACLGANEQELQDMKSQETELVEKIKHEEEINELSGKRRVLLADLEKNLNDLQEAQAIAAVEPSYENDEMIKELAAQRELLTASLEANLEDLEKVQAYVPGPGEESRLKQEEINELSEKRKTLLGNLKSNLKDLQEAQALAAIEPSTMNDEKVKELSEQRKVLAASLDTNLQELQRAQGYVPDPEEESRLKEAELNEQSEKKRLLQERLESNLKNLQQAQILATTQPESMDELKLRELIEERKHLTTELDTSEHVIRGIQREKELNELSQKKQLLLKNLESNLKDLEAAQAFADAEPGSIAEHKLQELTEQRRHLAADLDATLHHIEELHHQDEAPEVELQELSDKKQVLLGKLESTLKELQQAQALASAEPGGASEQKLQELTEQKRQLTVELESAILDMQEIQLRGEILKSREKEVYQLLEKKQVLLENLVSTLKELQEAHAVAAAEPGSASEEKIQVLREKGRRLTADLEEIAHDIKKAQQHASGRAELETPGEKELRGLTVRKHHLLQNLTSNLKELEQIQSLASSEPDSSTENQIQQLDEQRKVLSASLDTIIQQIKEVEGRVPETPKMPVVLKMDLDQLSQHKRLFLESLELNLKDLEEAQALAAAEPGGIAEQKVQELTEERRLLTAGLKAVTEDVADVESQELDKDAIMITREIILDELYQKERLILENLESNWKDLQQAEALAAAEPGGMSEEKIKELTEQRRLLASGLETIMQDIQEAEGLDRDKLEMLEKIEGGLAELSETTRQLWENLELNLSDLKNLHVLTPSEQDGMPEEQNQMLAEQRKHLTANLSALLQYMEDAQDLVLSGDQIISPDERYLDDVSEIKRLESKLDEILQIGGLSATQLDGMKEKLSKLKEKRELDRWDTFSQEPRPPTKEELAIYGSDDQVAGKLVGKKRYWSPNLQKRVRDLQQKNIREMQQKNMTLQGDISDKELQKAMEDKSSLEQCLVSVPLHILEDDTTFKYVPDDEQLAKRRALVAKLEANMKDLQAFHEAQQRRKATEKLASETSTEFLKPKTTGLQLQISKAPEIKKLIVVPTAPEVESETSIQSQPHKLQKYQEVKKNIPWHGTVVPTASEAETETPIQLQLYKLPKKDMELELRKHIMQQLKRTSLPYELTSEKSDMYNAVQEILDSNKSLLPAHKANLSQAIAIAQSRLQQANLVAAQKLLHTQPTPLSTARFHEYSVQPTRPAWEGSQLPATNYLQKLITLKKKLLSPELKGLLTIPSLSASKVPKSAATEEKVDSMLICGKGYRASRHGLTSSHHS